MHEQQRRTFAAAVRLGEAAGHDGKLPGGELARVALGELTEVQQLAAHHHQIACREQRARRSAAERARGRRDEQLGDES